MKLVKTLQTPTLRATTCLASGCREQPIQIQIPHKCHSLQVRGSVEVSVLPPVQHYYDAMLWRYHLYQLRFLMYESMCPRWNNICSGRRCPHVRHDSCDMKPRCCCNLKPVLIHKIAALIVQMIPFQYVTADVTFCHFLLVTVNNWLNNWLFVLKQVPWRILEYKRFCTTGHFDHLTMEAKQTFDQTISSLTCVDTFLGHDEKHLKKISTHRFYSNISSYQSCLNFLETHMVCEIPSCLGRNC